MKGATVKAGGKSLVTDASGRAATTLAPDSCKATARAPGFIGATGGVLARKPKPRQ